jgi:hypothetical protein
MDFPAWHASYNESLVERVDDIYLQEIGNYVLIAFSVEIVFSIAVEETLKV